MGRLGLVDLGGWGPGWLDVRQENARIPRLWNMRSSTLRSWLRLGFEQRFINNSQITRWFKVTFWFPTWRSLSPLKGSLNHPKKVRKNCPACVFLMVSFSDTFCGPPHVGQLLWSWGISSSCWKPFGSPTNRAPTKRIGTWWQPKGGPIWYIPDATCMLYLPTLGLNWWYT